MTFGLMALGFLATTNPGRVALAREEQRPERRTVVLALAIGVGLVVISVVAADPLLDALDVSPESFRIAAGLVVALCGAKTLVVPRHGGPFVAVLITPELVYLALSLGADESGWKVLTAAAVAFVVVALATVAGSRQVGEPAARFLATLGLVVAVVLVVSGVRDV